MMAHDIQNIIKGCRSTKELHCTLDYPTITKPDRLMHVMKMFYLDGNQNPPNSANSDYDSLRQIRRPFDYLINIYSTLYHPTETFIWGEVIVKFNKGRVEFRKCIYICSHTTEATTTMYFNFLF